MELLIVRHGPAGEASDWAKTGRPDSERPLTKDGRRKAAAAAKGLARICGRVKLVATSPWARAAQTAALLARACGAKVAECPFLVPSGSFADLAAWLGSRREDRLAVVGHEPHLSRFASWLMTGRDRPVLRLKKCQALLLEMEKAAPASALLIWSIPARIGAGRAWRTP